MHTEAPVSKIMQTSVVTIRTDEPVSAAMVLFRKHNFHHLPVLNPEGKLAGMISSNDVIRAYIPRRVILNDGSEQARSETVSVSEVMSPGPMSVEPGDTIGLAGDIFLSNRLHALVVVEDGEMLGIVTAHDLLAAAYNRISL